MIILSHTNLSGINLGGINLSEIKLGMPSGKGTGGEETFDPASFDEAWTVTGKTNDDEDRATVKNLTGNGNNLVLSNFAFAEDSGYGEYFWNFNTWRGNSNTKPISKTSSRINLVGSASSGGWGVINHKITGEELAVKVIVKITGLTSELPKMYFGKFDTGDMSSLLELKEGINVIDTIVNSSWGWYGFGFRKEIESCNITIEQIPDYEGYLVTDGVNDTLRCKNFNLGKDFTVIGDWALLNTSLTNAGLSLHPQIHVFNNVSDGVNVSFRGLNTRLSVKSLKAICSDGRCYDDDWNDLNIKVGDVISSDIANLFIGNNGTNYTKIAFKNSAIYNNKVLTKDQCIKAYNYLQTLKEK